jgi:hypothetical protein
MKFGFYFIARPGEAGAFHATIILAKSGVIKDVLVPRPARATHSQSCASGPEFASQTTIFEKLDRSGRAWLSN